MVSFIKLRIQNCKLLRGLNLLYNIIFQNLFFKKKHSIKRNVATDKGNSRNETWHWTNDEIRVAVQSWLWVRVELMAWYIYIYIYIFIYNIYIYNIYIYIYNIYIFTLYCNITYYHCLLNTRPYLSHLKTKIKRPVFQKNSRK